MSTEQSENRPPRRRSWRRRLLGGVLVLLAFAAAFPYLLSWGPFRRLVLAAAPTRLHGQVAIEQARLGWFSPPLLDKLEVQSATGDPVLEVEAVAFDLPLWQLAFQPSDLGTVKVDHPKLHLELHEQGSNFEDALGRPLVVRRSDRGAESRRPPPPIRRKIDLQIADASVAWRTPHGKQEWSVDKINLSLGLRPAWAAQSGMSEILVRQGKVVDHCQISPGMCDDVLKFAAPILSKVTRAEGEFSIDLDDWRLPLEHPEQGELGGSLSLHNVEVGPGNLVRSLAEALQLPGDIALARESIVRFELIDGRIHHRDLQFELPGAKIRTSGSVGFDRTLDLRAEVRLQLPAKLTEKSDLARSLSERTLEIPIGGTLAKPRLEAGLLKELGLAGLFDKLEGLGVKLPGGAKNAGSSPTTDEAAAGSADGKLLSDEAAALIEDLLRKWPERRKARREAAEANAAAGEEEPAAKSDSPPPKRRMLNRLRNRLRRPADGEEP